MDEHRLTEAVELLKSRDIKKRMSAVDMAAEIGSAGSVALLIKAIQDQSWSLREYAIKRISMTGKKAVKPLIRLLRDGVWYTRAAAIQALELIGDPMTISQIIPLTKDVNRSVADSAVKAVLGLARRTDGDDLYSSAASMTSQQRNAFLATLMKTDLTLGRKLEALMAGTPSGRSEVSGDGNIEEMDIPDRLQGLRRDIKAKIKQGEKAGDEDI
jgi:HEAT repeat protein